jgi:single-strand DNA-binding protein
MTNVVVLRGHITRAPEERELPSGDHLTTLDVTVPAGSGPGASTRAESVPVAWIGAPRWFVRLEPGSEVVVLGRVRRRFFRSGAGLQSRTEVVVDHGAPARQSSRCEAVLRRAFDALEDDPGWDGVRRR